jgi:hypothetical protein
MTLWAIASACRHAAVPDVAVPFPLVLLLLPDDHILARVNRLGFGIEERVLPYLDSRVAMSLLFNTL